MELALVKKEDGKLIFVSHYCISKSYILPYQEIFLTNATESNLAACRKFYNKERLTIQDLLGWLAEFKEGYDFSMHSNYAFNSLLEHDVKEFPFYFTEETNTLQPTKNLLSYPIKHTYGGHPMSKVSEEYSIEILAKPSEVIECEELGNSFRDGVTVFEAKGIKYVVAEDVDRCIFKVLRTYDNE